MDNVHARFANNSFAVFPRAQGASQLPSIFLTRSTTSLGFHHFLDQLFQFFPRRETEPR